LPCLGMDSATVSAVGRHEDGDTPWYKRYIGARMTHAQKNEMEHKYGVDIDEDGIIGTPKSEARSPSARSDELVWYGMHNSMKAGLEAGLEELSQDTNRPPCINHTCIPSRFQP